MYVIYFIEAHKHLTELTSPTLSQSTFNNTAYTTLSPNIITTNISGYIYSSILSDDNLTVYCVTINRSISTW